MKGLKPTLVTAISIGLLVGSAVGVAAQDSGVAPDDEPASMQVVLTDAAGDVPVGTPDFLDITEMSVSLDDDALAVRFEVAGDVPEAPEMLDEGGLVLYLGRDGGDVSVDPPEYWVDIHPVADGWKATFLQWRSKRHAEVDLDVSGNSLTATMPLSMLVPTDVLDEPDVQADMLVHGIGGYLLTADADHVPDGVDAWVPLAMADDRVPAGTEEVMAGIWPKWVADHPDPDSLELEEGLGPSAFTIYEHPDLPGVWVLPDDAWCEWASSYMNDDDGRPTGQGIQACLEGVVPPIWDRVVVPATSAELILHPVPTPPPSESPADGPVARTGEGSGTSDVFLLEGEVEYSVTVGAPVGCDDFEAWLQMRGAPTSMRETWPEGGVFYWEDTNDWLWGVSTPCDGRWAIVIEEAE